MTTRDDAIRAAGEVLAMARAELADLPPREAAERAWTPTGPSLDELEQRIRAMRTVAAAS